MPPRVHPVTIHDVAQVAGVSSATVSRVVNGRPTVDETLARRVLDAVAATGYVPNSTGRALRRQVSDTWAAIVSDVQATFFTGLVAAFEEVAARLGYSVMLCNSNEHVDRERRYIEAAVGQRMSGVVIAVASESKSDLSPLFRARVPVVLIDRRLHDHDGDSVLVDNELAGRLAAEHLAAQGYQRIACISGPRDVTSTEDRMRGFRSALVALSRTVRDEHIRRTNLRTDDGEIAIRSLLASSDPPDAVYTTTGVITAGAYRAMQQMGVRMPEDVGLVGNDDDDWTTLVQPSVTVIQQPVQRIGILAAELLNTRLADPDATPHHVTLAPVLVERMSSRGFARRSDELAASA